MLKCSQCGKEFMPEMKGWAGRIAGLSPAGRTDAALERVLLCPEDFRKLPAAARMAWHEFTGATKGPTREKRPGHLGEGA